MEFSDAFVRRATRGLVGYAHKAPLTANFRTRAQTVASCSMHATCACIFHASPGPKITASTCAQARKRAAGKRSRSTEDTNKPPLTAANSKGPRQTHFTRGRTRMRTTADLSDFEDEDSDPPYKPPKSLQIDAARPAIQPRARQDNASQNPSYSSSWRSSGSVDGGVPSGDTRAVTFTSPRSSHRQAPLRAHSRPRVQHATGVHENPFPDASFHSHGIVEAPAGAAAHPQQRPCSEHTAAGAAHAISDYTHTFHRSQLAPPRAHVPPDSVTGDALTCKPPADWASSDDLHAIAASAPWRPAGDGTRWRPARNGATAIQPGGFQPLSHTAASTKPSQSSHLQPAAALMLGGHGRATQPPAHDSREIRSGTSGTALQPAGGSAAPLDIPEFVRDWPCRTSQLDNLHNVRFPCSHLPSACPASFCSRAISNGHCCHGTLSWKCSLQ